VKLAEAIALAKKLNDMHGLALALCHAAIFGHDTRNPAVKKRVGQEDVDSTASLVTSSSFLLSFNRQDDG
jgi:hypothetical protein